MRNNQRQAFYVFALLSLSAILAVFGAGAQQKPEQDAKQKETQKPARQSNNQPPQQGADDPVAITERAPVEKVREAPPAAISSENFGSFYPPIINNKGEVAFISMFGSSTAKDGIGRSIFVRGADGGWRVTREGDKAANLSKGIYGLSPMYGFNDNGDLTFIASFEDESAKKSAPHDPNDPLAKPDRPLNRSIYFKSASGMKSLLKLGEEVPAMPSHFSGFSSVSTNNQGVTAFIGTYSDPDGKGLLMIEGGKLRLICRSGQPIGNGETGAFSEHYYPTPINERNEVAFLARIGDKSGIFVSRPKGLELITISGKPAPVEDATFIGFGNRAPAISDSGEIAFIGFWGGDNFGRGLFTKGDGPIKLVAKSGDKIGDTGATFTDFFTPAINSRGEVAFIGRYGGRSQGIFIKTAKGIEMIALVDQPVPGGAKDEVFNNLTQPSINDRGEVVFLAQTKIPGVKMDFIIFIRDEKGNLKQLVRRGEKMPK